VLADAGQEVESGTLLAADSQDPLQKKKKIVILGTGWGGISFLKTLDCKLFDVQIVSPRNYFVFTPLLPSVTVGTVEARSVTEPIRRIIRKKDAEFHEAECIKIDPENKQVICKDVSELDFERKPEFALDYDYLVIAVGATSNTFGTKGVDEYCHFLKDVEDAEKIREQIVDIFETASLPHLSPEVRRNLLSFVVVGGGPTGVEFSAELHDLVHEDLLCLYPHLKDSVTITLVQSGDHILNTFDKRISQFAEKKFRRDRVHVKIGCRVLEVTNKHIRFKSKDTGQLVDVPYGMIVWATGKWLICCSGILNVRTSCSVKQHNQNVTIFDR
jgi:NADH:ubiquinone reductase (non-electrogenic)